MWHFQVSLKITDTFCDSGGYEDSNFKNNLRKDIMSRLENSRK